MIVKYPVKHYSTDKVFFFLQKEILPLCHTLQFTLREYIACQNTLYSYAIYGNTGYGVSNLLMKNPIMKTAL